MSYKRRPETGFRWPLVVRLSKLLADPLRLKILVECRRQEMSPRRFHEAFGDIPLIRVQRAFDVLLEYGWLDPTQSEGERSRVDAVERLYRGAEDAQLDASTWLDMPGSVKELFSTRIVDGILERAQDAVEAGTMDARDDRHLTWTPLTLDRRGWETVISRVDALFYALSREQQDAEARMAESGEEPIPMTVALMAFESPMPEPAR